MTIENNAETVDTLDAAKDIENWFGEKAASKFEKIINLSKSAQIVLAKGNAELEQNTFEIRRLAFGLVQKYEATLANIKMLNEHRKITEASLSELNKGIKFQEKRAFALKKIMKKTTGKGSK